MTAALLLRQVQVEIQDSSACAAMQVERLAQKTHPGLRIKRRTALLYACYICASSSHTPEQQRQAHTAVLQQGDAKPTKKDRHSLAASAVQCTQQDGLSTPTPHQKCETVDNAQCRGTIIQ